MLESLWLDMCGNCLMFRPWSGAGARGWGGGGGGGVGVIFSLLWDLLLHFDDTRKLMSTLYIYNSEWPLFFYTSAMAVQTVKGQK